MITCPECGQAAPDDAKFCDRCGRGLSKTEQTSSSQSATRPAPLKPGVTLKGGIEIVELTGQTSIENRYRAKRTHEGKTATVILRERLGPLHTEEVVEEEPEPEPAPTPTPAEDPNGPRAKTAELKTSSAPHNGTATPQAPHAAAESTSGASASAVTDEGGVSSVAAEASTEATATQAEPAQAPETHDAATNGGGDFSEDSRHDFGFGDDLGEVFGRVLALSQTISHPAFQRASEGFAENGRVYLVYADDVAASLRPAAGKMSEPEAIACAVQICQAIAFVHRRALRLNDICPESVAVAKDGRLKLTGLDYVSNDNELQAEPIFNDGYTAPEIYRGKRVDKRADIFRPARCSTHG